MQLRRSHEHYKYCALMQVNPHLHKTKNNIMPAQHAT